VVIVFAYDKFTEVFMGHDERDDQRGWAVGAVADAAGFKFGLLAAYLKDESRIRFPAGDLSYMVLPMPSRHPGQGCRLEQAQGDSGAGNTRRLPLHGG